MDGEYVVKASAYGSPVRSRGALTFRLDRQACGRFELAPRRLRAGWPAGLLRMQVELLDAGAPGWRAALTGLPHDLYHLPEYQRFAARWQYPGEPVLFVAREAEASFVLPLILRPIPATTGVGEELYDAVSSRFFPGPLVQVGPEGDRVAFATHAIEALRGSLASRGIVAAFVRLHPLIPPPLGALRRTGVVADHGDAVAIDLTLSDEELWQQTRHNHRRDINRAKRIGYRVRIDNTWERLDDFATIHAETMARLEAGDVWRLSPAYFRDIRDSMSEYFHLCVAEWDGDLAAAALLTEVDGIVEYHLAGTAERCRGERPSKLIIHVATHWAKRRGNRVLHLTGSLRRGDSLNHFKVGFSPLQYPMYSWRLVADEAAYEALVGDWQSRTGTVADQPDGFFPAYRKSLPAPSLGTDSD